MLKKLLLLNAILFIVLAHSQCPNNDTTDSDGDGVLDCIDPCNSVPNSIIGNLSFESDFIGWHIPQNQSSFSITQDANNTLHGTKALYVSAPNSAQFETHAIESEEFTLQAGVGYSFNIPVKRVGTLDTEAFRWALVDENGTYRNLNNYYNITENWTTISISNLNIDFSTFTSNRFRLRFEFGLSQNDMIVDRVEFFETSQGYDPTYEDNDSDGIPDCTDPALLVPDNDLIENAIVIPTNGTFIDENLRLDLATANGIGGSDCGVDNFERVYYKFTATDITSLTISLSDPNSQPINPNSFLIPYTAPDLNQTNENQLLVLPGYCTFSTSTTFTTTPGQSYYIQVCRNLDAGQLSNINVSVAEDSSQAERDALIAFFNANGGSTTWTNATNWNTSQPVGAWFGVTVENGTVTKLQLSNNGITGSDLSDLINLPNLNTLELSSNSFSGSIPDFGTLVNLETLNIRNNLFSFLDFETNFTSNSTISNFIYSPQKVVDTEESIEGIIGNDYSFSMTPIAGTNVNYQWYISNTFNQDPDSNPVAGANSNVLSFTNLQAEDLNSYICIATSSLISDLQYIRPLVDIFGNVSTQERDALIAFYNALDGPNWNNNTNWTTTQPVKDWFGITTAGNKVIGIDFFGDNGLNGELPIEIGDLLHLEYLGLGLQPTLTGALPESIGNLSNLKRLRIQGTGNSGALPNTIGDLSALQEFRLIGNNFSGDLPTTIGNLTNLEDFYLIGSTFPFNGVFNQFTGELPDLTGNPNLFRIQVSGNNFSGVLPDYSVLPNMNTLIIDENLYSFSDLQVNQANNLNIEFYVYSPQRNTSEPENITIPPGQSITLDVNGMATSRQYFNLLNTDQYQWFKDNEAITGAMASTYTINDPQPSDSGVYYCEITNSTVDGLVVTRAEITLNVDSALSINDTSISNFRLYPNPAKNWLTVSSSSLQNFEIAIYDLNGRLILDDIASSNTTVLNIENLEAGIYVLKIANINGNKATKRFIKR